MGELTVRRGRGVAAPSYQAAERTEKTAGAARSRPAAKAPGFTVSETLRELMGRVGRAEGRTRESHRTLQVGEAVLAEVRDILDRIGELADRAASGGDRAALQAELEHLRTEVDRMTGGAEAGGVRLFLDGEMDVTAAEGTDAAAGAEGEEGAQALPGWLLEALSRDGSSPERLLSMLGLDRRASGAELLAAVMGRALEGDAAAGALAALYLGAVIGGGAPPDAADLQAALEGLRRLLEEVDGGMPPDRAVELLTDGAFTSLAELEAQFTSGTAPGLQDFLTGLLLGGGDLTLPPDASMLTLLAGMEGMDLELLMGLLAAVQSSETVPEAGAGPGEAVPEGAAPEAAGPDAAPSRPAVLELGELRAVGRDLSGVSVREDDGGVTVSGTADVALQGTGERALLLRGSGTVTLQDAEGAALSVEAPLAHVSSPGETVLGELRLRPGASLVLSGGGLVRLASLHAGGSSVLRLDGVAVELAAAGEGEDLGTLALPVVLDGPASLAARAADVRDASGKALSPFDVVWRTLLPGWAGVDALSVAGRQARLVLPYPEPMRLWLDRGDPSQGSPVQEVVIRGKDRLGRPRVRYAYLRWDERAGGFEEVSMYPDPFTVTGGEAGRDWVYEEEVQTLRILTGQVTAIAGGAGVDAEQRPFSGKIVLEDGIGALELTLRGVDCRPSSGGAFRLGRGNDVTLLLRGGSRNCFESGAGFAGISLGEGSSLCIDCPDARDGGIPAGELSASGGDGGAGIGRDSGGGRDQTGWIEIRDGRVTALGTGGGAGIGAGRRGAFGAVVLLGGTIAATGGKGGGAGIGGALDAPAGDISIRGGTVSAAALGHAAAIGAGARGECGGILITGTARIVKALGGDPGADIGACLFGGCGEVRISGAADIGRARLWTRTGVPLQMGEETVTLPQFRLSSRALGLDQISLATREAVKAAQAIIDADRRWVAQIQTAYSVLYDRLERSSCALRGVQRYFRETGLVRDTAAAGTLLDGMRRSIPLSSGEAARAHGKRGKEDVRQLLR